MSCNSVKVDPLCSCLSPNLIEITRDGTGQSVAAALLIIQRITTPSRRRQAQAATSLGRKTPHLFKLGVAFTGVFFSSSTGTRNTNGTRKTELTRFMILVLLLLSFLVIVLYLYRLRRYFPGHSKRKRYGWSSSFGYKEICKSKLPQEETGRWWGSIWGRLGRCGFDSYGNAPG